VASLGLVYAIFDCYRESSKFWAANGVDPAKGRQPLLQFFGFLFLSTVWVLTSTVYSRMTRVFLLAIGFSFTYQISRLIVAAQTKMEYAKWQITLWPLPLVVLNNLARIYLRRTFVDESTIAYVYLAYIMAFYLHFIVSVVNEICTSLGIRCFTIPNKSSSVSVKKAK